MPRERPQPAPFEPAALSRSLDRYLAVGLAFIVVLIAGFVAYRVREPSLRSDAFRTQRSQYIDLGRGLFADNCAECHGDRAAGGGDAPTLASKEFLGSTSDDQAHHVIAAGVTGTEMSAWSIDFGGTLTDQQIRQIVTYLRSLERDAPSIPDWRRSGTADGESTEPAGDHDGGGEPAGGHDE